MRILHGNNQLAIGKMTPQEMIPKTRALEKRRMSWKKLDKSKGTRIRVRTVAEYTFPTVDKSQPLKVR